MSRIEPIDEKQSGNDDQRVFQDSEEHDIKYNSLSWQFVSILMIAGICAFRSQDNLNGAGFAEIVSNGMLTLPSSLAVVGIVPAVTLIVFLGIFGLYTAKLLIDFKLNHPQVHNMGDAGYVLGGPVVKEILGTGTIIFAIAGTGSELLSGQQALSVLSDNGLCAMHLLLIFSVATLLVALPRTLSRLSWLGLVSVGLITLAGIVAMVGAGLSANPDRVVQATVTTTFYSAFLSVTNPVFSYAGHFMFFILISEMRRPEDAMKAAWCLQGFATTFYTVYACVIYAYIGNTVASPALFSLQGIWPKVTFGIAIGNFLVAGSLYTHTAAKLVFVRLFRRSTHIYHHTVLGWSVWITLCIAAVGIAFLFAIAVPIFSYLSGIAASLFAAWFTYGLAGWFWLHDITRGGVTALKGRPIGTILAILTILAGGFISVAGTYVSVKSIIVAYANGVVGKPFTC